MRRSIPTAALTLAMLTLTAGCGGSSAPPAVGFARTSPFTRSASSTSSMPPASATTTAIASTAPDATIGYAFSTGDHVEVTYGIAAPVSFSAAGTLAQSCASQLQNDPSRALVYGVAITARLTTAMGGKFTLRFGEGLPLAVQYGDGQQRCWSVGEVGYTTLTLNPGATERIQTWLVADGAKTPAFSDGDPERLREAVFTPSMYAGVADIGANTPIDYAYGSRVWVCDPAQPSQMSVEVFADAGTYAVMPTPRAGTATCVQAVARTDFDAVVSKMR